MHSSHTLIHRLPFIVLLITLLLPASMPARGEAIEVIIEDPQLHPAFTDCPDSYWYPFDNDRGHTAYLTLNAHNPANSANYAEWHPTIPQSGYYQVSAYIGAHSTIPWCTGTKPTIEHDTTDAHYTIHSASGVFNISLSQYPLSNQWLDLGEYYFTEGQTGYVSLADLTSEPDFSTVLSFSAMRFTFTRPMQPVSYLPLVRQGDPSGKLPADVGVIQAQGFDTCHLPEVAEMHTWWHQSPYSFYALYLGGVQLGSLCTIANAAWVSQVHQQGWSFVPTWVGLQAPCTEYPHRMSSDPAVSFLQGRQEAEAASIAAASMGLTNSRLGGTIIYYDLEAYGYSSSECRQPVSSFMNGWVQRLHELGNLAGGYGTRNSFVTDWASIANVPDDIWPAYWYTNNYDPYASAYGIPWIQGLWTMHQRIRQYAGDHPEHWGGVGLPLDNDVADGMVAMPPAMPVSTAAIITSPTIEDTGWLSAEQGWVITNGQLYWTSDGGQTWSDVSPGPVQRASFTPSRQAWAISIRPQAMARLFHSSDWGTTWESTEIALPMGDWQPLQLQFTSTVSGWMVLRKVTSRAFDIGLLLKSSDGGKTWQLHSMPTAAPIEFVSEDEGWLKAESTAELFHSTDGGLTWQPFSSGQTGQAVTSSLAGSVLSGQQANGFGWSLTSIGTCRGEKSTPDFTCQTEMKIWQTQDGGQGWRAVPLPTQGETGQ